MKSTKKTAARKPGEKIHDDKGRLIGTHISNLKGGLKLISLSDNVADDSAEDKAAELAAAKARRDFRRMLRRKRNASWFEALWALPDNR